jgi:hypothetical protein
LIASPRFGAACESGYWRPRNKKKKAKTIADERKLLNRHIKRPFGALRIEEIDKATIKQLLRGMLDPGHPGSDEPDTRPYPSGLLLRRQRGAGPHQSSFGDQADGR